MADLPRAGREYFTWPITSGPLPDGVELELFIAGGWHVAATASDRATVSLLLQGPMAPTDVPSAIVVPTDQDQITGRVVDSPEIIIRTAGYIRLTDA